MSRASKPRARSPVAGFTLLEVLVALVCFALLFGVMAQIMRTGLRQSAAAEAAATAGLLARSQLARVGVELPLTIGEVTGEVDGMRWRTAIGLAEPLGEQSDIATYRIDVTVAWEGGQTLTLTTLRLGPPPGTGLEP